MVTVTLNLFCWICAIGTASLILAIAFSVLAIRARGILRAYWWYLSDTKQTDKFFQYVEDKEREELTWKARKRYQPTEQDYM